MQMLLPKVGSKIFFAAEQVCQRYGSADPDPYQNVTDSQHCLQGTFSPSITFGYVSEPHVWSEEPTFGANNAQSDHELAEVELLRENLLHVLVPLHRESPVRHHEMNPWTQNRKSHILYNNFGRNTSTAIVENTRIIIWREGRRSGIY